VTQLEHIATIIAIEAPARRSYWSNHAYVSWDLIERLRRELDRQGIDWRELRARSEEIIAKRRQR
jgi:hypothetical protein